MASEFLYSQDILGGPRGLVNSENNCYISTLVQCLFGCKDFRDFYVSRGFQKFIRYDTVTAGMMSTAVSELLGSVSKVCKEPHDLDDFFVAVRASWSSYKKNEQMDLHEFLVFLFDTLHEEGAIGVPDKPVDHKQHDAVTAWEKVKVSPISHIFGMQIVTQLKCSHCNYSRCTFDDTSTVLSVSLLSDRITTIKNCLDEFFGEEPLPSMKCPSCLNPTIRHRLILGRLPPVMIVHLKRFECNFNSKVTSKLSCAVEYSVRLDLKEYSIQGLQTSTEYRLVGVANHHGPFLHNGHYTALSQRGHRWYHINDTQVSYTTTRNLCTSAGYVLFYVRETHSAGQLPFDASSTATVEAVLQSATNSLPKDHDNNNNDCNSGINFDYGDYGDYGDHGDPDSDQLDNDNGNDQPFKDDMNTIEFAQNSHKSDKDRGAQPNTESPVIPNLESLHLNVSDRSTDLSTDILNIDWQQQQQNEDGETVMLIHHQPTNTQVDFIQHSDCQHPNFDLDLIDPVLNEDDVPGAKLDLALLEDYPTDKLRRWLACRGMLQKGRRAQLIERILNHKRDAHKIFPGVDKGKWYEKKRRKVADKACEVMLRFPVMPLPIGKSSLWNAFPSAHIPNNYCAERAIEYLKAIPEFRFSYKEGVVQKSIIKIMDEDEDEDEDGLYDMSLPSQEDRMMLFVNGTLKRANLFVESARVLSVEDCERDKHYYVKAQVEASMVKRAYGINVMISKSSGSVCLADCSCKARALGRCCHVMAVLLLIGRHVEIKGHEAITCTGRKCYWIAPSTSLSKMPGVIQEKPGYYPKINFHRRGHFDPRPTAHQTDGEADEGSVKKFSEFLSKMPTKLLWYYQLQRELVQLQQQHIEVVGEDDEYPDIEFTEAIANMCSYLLWNLNQIRHYSSSEPLHFPLTRHQTASPRWPFERAVRVPASKCKEVLGLASSRSTANGKINFLRKHVWQLDPFRNEAMEYGSSLEGKARKAYAAKLKMENPEYDVIETGTWVNPKHPYLSCSPDGIIVDTNGFVKLLEIKCPAVLMHMDPNDFEQLPPYQLRNFCLFKSKETGIVELKQTNSWYYQIQQSLDILCLDVCDFIVYSEINTEPRFIKIEVPYNETFWREKRERLAYIHRSLIVPEFFLYKSIFKRPVSPLQYTHFHEDHDDMYFYLGCDPEVILTVETETEFLINFE